MENVLTAITALSSSIKSLLLQMDIQPSTYSYLFPKNHQADIDANVKLGLFPTIPDLAPALTYALLLSISRLVLHYILFKPLAKFAMKISDSDIVTRIPDNLTPKDKERIRKKNKMNNKKIVKFVEAFWRMMFYGAFCVVGIQTLFYDKNQETDKMEQRTAVWITTTMEHWRGWPSHPVSEAIKFYYQVELGAYIHQLLWTEVSRSDAYEMIIHHVTTISLITFSYLTNYTRYTCTHTHTHTYTHTHIHTYTNTL